MLGIVDAARRPARNFFARARAFFIGLFILIAAGVASGTASAATTITVGTVGYSFQTGLSGGNLFMQANVNNTGATTSGTLRVEMWAATSPFNGSNLAGVRLGVTTISTNNGVLTPGQFFANVPVSGSSIGLATGTYYITYIVTEFQGGSCALPDGYCPVGFKFADTIVITNGAHNSAIALGTTTPTFPAALGGLASGSASSITNVGTGASGQLRAELWASAIAYSEGGGIAGFRLGQTAITQNGGILNPNQSFSGVSVSGSTGTLPAGTYFLSYIVTEFNNNPSCPSIEHFCIVAGRTMGSFNTAGGGGGANNTNDFFANATLISGNTGTIISTNVGATAEGGEPAHAGFVPTASAWLRWTAPANAVYEFNTSGTNFDTLLGIYIGTSVSNLTEAAANDDIDGANNRRSKVRFTAVAGQTYMIAVDGFNGATGNFTLNWTIPGDALPQGLFASTLPYSRAVAPNTIATVFANISNTGGSTATNCRPVAPLSFPGAYGYQTLNTQNVAVGAANTPINIAAGSTQGFLLLAATSQIISGGELGFLFMCDNYSPAPLFIGANSWVLRVQSPQPADIIAVGATTVPGIMPVALNGGGFMAVSALNIGSAQAVTVTGTTNAPGMSMSVCETTLQVGGACINAPTASVSVSNFAAGQARTFTFFAQSNGVAVPLDPGRVRVYARFTQTSTGVLVGATSAAIQSP